MVEYNQQLDSLFLSLADATRRDILRLLRVYNQMSVSQIAVHYKLTFAAISKHLMVLEMAKLITKRRKGKMQIVRLSKTGFKDADEYLKQYSILWDKRMDRLEALLNEA